MYLLNYLRNYFSALMYTFGGQIFMVFRKTECEFVDKLFNSTQFDMIVTKF